MIVVINSLTYSVPCSSPVAGGGPIRRYKHTLAWHKADRGFVDRTDDGRRQYDVYPYHDLTNKTLNIIGLTTVTALMTILIIVYVQCVSHSIRF